jgi:hypothetical protein
MAPSNQSFVLAKLKPGLVGKTTFPQFRFVFIGSWHHGTRRAMFSSVM